jgi:hypothetical protein
MLDRYAGIALKHLPRAPDYNQLVQLASCFDIKKTEEHEPRVLAPLGHPVYSASARVQMDQSLYMRSRNHTASIRKATAGGTIRVNGIDCLLTAAHAFDDAFVLSSESERLEEELRFSVSDEAEEECQIMVAEAQSLGSAQKAAWGYQDCVVRALMCWFKRSFLTWVEHPICSRCNSATVVVGLTAPLPEEQA